MGAQEEMQAQSLSSTRPWSAAAQEQSYSAFAKMAFQDGLVCSHKNQGADPSKCLLIAWKPKSFQPSIWGQPGGNISWVWCLSERMTQAGYTRVILISLFCYFRKRHWVALMLFS